MADKALKLRGRWVLVTGASAGLGRELALQLARDHGAHLILMARRQALLESLAEEVTSTYGVQAVPLVADLCEPARCEALLEEITRERPLAAAVLNAGITHYGDALDLSGDALNALIHTNVTSLVTLAGAIARRFKETSEPGALLLVSSVGGFLPLPYQAAYAGSKAFVTHYGLALGVELAGTGISVTVFAAGGMPTDLVEKSGLGRKFKADQLGMMPVPKAARMALQAMCRRESLRVPGVMNQALAFVTRLVPRRFMAARAGDLYRPLPPG
ncbi:MAG TPA: SDR family NAD(P)-dependent oxidoreductase [Myxococcaceae bacterium]|nr:SDR family NAD(P)-dependent oxidoreductase [Myxococcaceae bacterium]